MARDQHVQHDHREHGCQTLRYEHAYATEAENLRAGSLQPQAEWWLVDGNESTGIEGDEKEVVPALRHALDCGRVIRIGVSLAGQVYEVEDGGEQNHASQ